MCTLDLFSTSGVFRSIGGKLDETDANHFYWCSWPVAVNKGVSEETCCIWGMWVVFLGHFPSWETWGLWEMCLIGWMSVSRVSLKFNASKMQMAETSISNLRLKHFKPPKGFFKIRK